jgi:hypothetical protein
MEAPARDDTVFILRATLRGYDVVKARVVSRRGIVSTNPLAFFAWRSVDEGEGTRFVTEEGVTWSRPEGANRLRVVAALR